MVAAMEIGEGMADRTGDAATVAQLAGRAEAERFEAALRRLEDRERAERRASLAGAVETEAWLADPESARGEIARLKRQVESLASFRAAVLHSKAWRATQVLRALFCREW